MKNVGNWLSIDNKFFENWRLKPGNLAFERLSCVVEGPKKKTRRSTGAAKSKRPFGYSSVMTHHLATTLKHAGLTTTRIMRPRHGVMGNLRRKRVRPQKFASCKMQGTISAH